MSVLLLEPGHLRLRHRITLHLLVDHQRVRLACRVQLVLKRHEVVNAVIGGCSLVCPLHRVVQVVLRTCRVDVVNEVVLLLIRRVRIVHRGRGTLHPGVVRTPSLDLGMREAFIRCRLIIHQLELLIERLLLVSLLESPLVLDDFLLDVLVLLLIGVGSLDQMIHALHVLGIALLATELMFLGELLHQSVDEGLLMTDDWLWL